jgi:hypothetical protein
MSDIERYLERLNAELPLPHDLRAEVTEEIARHLADSTDALVAAGIERDAAEAAAIARLGTPRALARELSRSHRRGPRLLAAAGAGTFGAVRDGLLGTLLGWFFVVLAVVLGQVVVSAIGHWLSIEVNLSWEPGWNTVITALGLNVGALAAGGAGVRAASRSGWRSPEEIRGAVVVVGGLVIAWIVLVATQYQLNWASVAVLMAAPVSFVAGTHFYRLGPPRPRTVAAALLLMGVIGVGSATLVHAVLTVGEPRSYSWSTLTHGYEVIAPWWQDPASEDPPAFIEGSVWGTEGSVMVSVDAASPALASNFHDLRLEAWRAEPPGDGWRLLPDQTTPFATAPATRDGATIQGTLQFNRTPDVIWAQVVLTGIGPDGTRYLLNASGPEPTIFSGSVWDWFARVAP